MPTGGRRRVWPGSLKILKDPSLPCSWMVCSLSFCLFPRPMKPLGSHGLTLGPTLCNKLLPENVSFRVNPLDFVSIFHSVHFSFPSLLPLPACDCLAAGDEGGSHGSKARKEADGTAEKSQGEHIVWPQACGKVTMLMSHTTLFCIEC